MEHGKENLEESFISFAPLPTDEPLEAHDPHWSGVDFTHRKWRDVVFLGIFLVVLALTVALSAYGYTHGDPLLFQVLGKSWDWLGFSFAQLYQLYGGSLSKRAGERRWTFILLLIACVVTATVWVLLLQRFARVIVIVSLVAAVVAIAASGIALISHGTDQNLTYAKVLGALVLVSSLGAIGVCVWQRHRIALTIHVIEEAAHGLRYNPMLLLITAALGLLVLSLTALWALSVPFLFTVTLDGAGFSFTPRVLVLFSVFGFFLVIRTLTSVLEATVAGAVATWYFARSPYGRREPGSPALNALGRACTKSLGSLAFGALVLALCDLMALLLRLADRDSDNRVVRYLLNCVRCVLSMFRSVLQTLNRFAIVYIAMYGESFCRSGRRVSALLGRAGFDLVVLDSVVWLTVTLIRVAFTAACALALISVFSARGVAMSPGPLFAVCLGASMVFKTMGVMVEAATNTVFVCYAEDMERNRESGQFFASSDLHTRLQLLKGKH